jgi:hypothetical protein
MVDIYYSVTKQMEICLISKINKVWLNQPW